LKAEVTSERYQLRHGPSRVDDAAVNVIQSPMPEPQIKRYELSNDESIAIKRVRPDKPRVWLSSSLQQSVLAAR
jgi:hypothetical protein